MAAVRASIQGTDFPALWLVFFLFFFFSYSALPSFSIPTSLYVASSLFSLGDPLFALAIRHFSWVDVCITQGGGHGHAYAFAHAS
jgi:hypothetical protein